MESQGKLQYVELKRLTEEDMPFIELWEGFIYPGCDELC